MTNSAPIKIMLIEDHPVVRHGVKSLLSFEDDLLVVAEASSGEEALPLFAQHRPDVTLTDLRLPGIGGAEVITRVRRDFPGSRFIVLTTFDSDQYVHQAILAGAQGYLLKDMFVDEIVKAVRIVHQGGKVIPHQVAERLADSVGQAQLSPRELQVLTLIAKGQSNKIIANELGVSEGTIKTHIVRLFGKLGVTDRTSATTAAIQRGILKL